ncbi:hypothetical protein WJX74_004513 [Apatococcus lobatus]|uniref:Peptidase S54 rhomboid domain-containing protein n=1 Tax=Apatococcus lobatus TaxID=904363 RepID=A0AAW1REE8_9CHLO
MRGLRPWAALGLLRAASARSFASGLQQASSSLALKQKPPAAPSSLWETLKLCGFTLGVVEGSFWLAGQARQQHWSLKQRGPGKHEEADRKSSLRLNSQEMIASIIGTNLLVFLVWKLPRPSIQRYMLRNFTQHLPPSRTLAPTLLTSAYSHMEIWHLGANMWALWSFGKVTALIQGTEQFLAFYLSAAVVASLAGHVGGLRAGKGGISLGASGAIYGLVGLLAYTLPHLQASIIFVPFSTDLSQLLAAFMALDVLGIVLGWRTFNHWAHLGGAIFGLLYGPFISKRYWPEAESQLKSFREKFERKQVAQLETHALMVVHQVVTQAAASLSAGASNQ